ncbi:uncharacterized protein B0P05DRAFT_564844 [Gilbertella persicaria]|uniref:uncharacterized protein n=1 Tax=Gilbertella persicaria TaxID=101096 RepID=UPI00221F4CF2|nr:uncharacterized protein B0P05DRAFT_564844 [Gilbertella persicaria]KAI8048048.1 hypothetical protein B0P05DRAFT_564844 [Gilbertella persicaria]
MTQNTDWSTFHAFKDPARVDNKSNFLLSSPSSVPSMFDPFDIQQQKEEQEDDMHDLSQRFISSHLLDDDEDEDRMVNTPIEPSVWNKTWKPTSEMKDIWNTSHESSFEPDVDEFDPTLQFYHGSLYDAHTIQDMNRLLLQVTNPSAEEAQAENVDEDMSTLQMMQTIFSDLKDEELIATLEQHDYDVDRAIEALLTQKLTIEKPPVVPETPKKRQVCRHFLAGECYRKDCWFAHDLQEKVCKFWLQGSCLKGDSCEFSHGIDIQEVANKITIPETKPKVAKPIVYHQGDYPALSASKTPKYQSQPQPQQQDDDEFPSLAAASTKKSTKQPTMINFAQVAKKKKTSPIKQKKQQTFSRYHTKSYKYSMQELTRPVHIPWLETGSSLNSIYMKEREKAIEYGMLRNRFFSKATEYYLKGDGAKAKLYSMEAKHYNRLMQEMHTEASQRIFEQRSNHEAFIDLHGLHEDEALSIVEERLHHLKSCYSGIIYIVTGTGHHSGRNGLSKKQSKLKPSIQQYLKQHHYRFAETSIVGDNQGGVFAVEI